MLSAQIQQYRDVIVKRYIDGQKLQKLRNEVGLTQEELGNRLGISRETVVAIENNYPGTIENLSFTIVEAWTRTCRSKSRPALLAEWEAYVKKLLGIP